MLFELNLINLVLFCEKVMILKNKSNFQIMLDFNPILDFRLYRELQMLDWIVLYMDQNLRENLYGSKFVLWLKPNFTFKDVKFCLEA